MGFGSQIHKSIEGQVYSAVRKSRHMGHSIREKLIASSAEVPRFVPSLQISANGEWIMADQMLMQLSTVP